MAESDKNYLLRRINFGTDLKALQTFPSYFEIETINACQARCPMCTISNWERQPQVMKPELFEKIAQELEENARCVKRVHLYRDGEPLLDKKLPGRISRLKNAGIREVGISTNVELLTEECAKELFAARIDEIILSIDSMKPDVYRAIRVGLDFDKVIANARRAIQIRDKMGSMCRIRVRMIRQESNAEEWRDGSFRLYWQCKVRRGHDSIEMRNIHNWGGQLIGYKEIIKADTSRPCLALWSLFVIFANGGVVPLCNVDYNAKFPLGNVRDSTIRELWQSAEQNRRRDLHMSHNRKAIAPCEHCTVWSEEAKHAPMDA